MSKRNVLVWFRNDLRVQDNEMLSRASERGEKITPVFCYDPRYYATTPLGTKKTGITRAKFINESVSGLQEFFKANNGNLIIKVGHPEDIIPELAKQYNVDEVYHHREVADEETNISSLVEDALWRIKINLRHFIGHTLYHKEDFPFPVKDIPDSFTIFKKILERESYIRKGFETPVQFTFPDDLEKTEVPSLLSLGFEGEDIGTSTSLYPGGEKEAQKRLPLLTNLSPYIALGCLSVHSAYEAIANSKLPKKKKEEVLLGLWWKDYYRFMFKKHGNIFFKEKGYTGNVPVTSPAQIPSFELWKSGQTGDAEVNALMKELNHTGYIDFAAREQVALYLINQLQVSWLWGAAYFEEKLIDYNPSTTYGNWAHLAGVGSSQEHNRIPFQGVV